MKTLTAKQARQALSYNPDTGHVIRLESTRGDRIGKRVGIPSSSGTLQVHISGKLYTLANVVWLLQTGRWPARKVEHINGDRTDLRWTNLRMQKPRKVKPKPEPVWAGEVDGDVPSIETLREVYHYDPDTGILTSRVRLANCVRSGQAVGTAKRDGYLALRLKDRVFMVHRVAWAIHTGAWPVDQLDHINGVRHDNRFCNLREVSSQENHRNRKLPADNTSGHVGVVWTGVDWCAQIGINGTTKKLGYFETFEEAVVARKAAEREHGFHDNHGKPQAERGSLF